MPENNGNTPEDDWIRRFERMKKEKGFDAQVAENIPLLSSLSAEDIRKLDVRKIEENVRQNINVRIVRQLRDNGLF